MTVDQERYTRVAVALHWAIAAFIALNLIIGSFMEHLPGALRPSVVRVHESFGATVFALTLVRIGWRLTHRAPPFAAHYSPWERHLAHAVHGLLYFLMLAMPLTGWMIISLHLTRPMVLYGSLVLPPLQYLNHLPEGAAKTALHTNMITTHMTGAWILLSLLLLHVAGALKHQLFDGEAEIARMWFRRGLGRDPRLTDASLTRLGGR